MSQTLRMVRLLSPPPASTRGRRVVVAPDVERIQARLRFDVATQVAEGQARVEFVAGEADGRPALDLRQEVTSVRLDGKELGPEAFAHVDLGGGKNAEMRAIDAELEAGSRHRLDVHYRVGRPSATGALPIGWAPEGVRFDLWMSDLEPGRYLEMWVPAPLVHDQFSLEIDIELVGKCRPHMVLANTSGVDASRDDHRWSLCWSGCTSLSPMLVLAPADEVETRRGSLTIPGRQRSLGLVVTGERQIGADLAACEADIAAWLRYLAARYGPWVHGDTFWAFVWSHGRGMEYDGATTAAVDALEHEVFHSWFGRGVKPARAADGWIDEAFTTWATASQRVGGARFGAEELGLDEPPVELYPPHPWARRTAIEAYGAGARLFSGLAHQFGGAGRLRSAMADWYKANAGQQVTTDGLAAHLQAWSGVDISPWWARYVHGRT